MQRLIEKAWVFARNAHYGQYRTYTCIPYIQHPMAVAGIVSSITDNVDIIAAAILHDVVEDTEVSIIDIFNNFRESVTSMVDDLTDISIPSDGNRKTRKRIDLLHTQISSPFSKTIKLADLIDNTTNIVPFDPEFAKIYMEEKRELLEVLKEGDNTLYSIAKNQVDKYYSRIDTKRGK